MLEVELAILEAGMVLVLLAEDDVAQRQLPVDADVGIVPGDGAFGLGVIEVVALVLEDGTLGKHGEAMGKALRNKELTVVLGTELAGEPLPEGGRGATQVDSHIEHPTLDAAHQLALGVRGLLEMQTAHHAIAGFALVILDESYL